jgi:hypothetical protein
LLRVRKRAHQGLELEVLTEHLGGVHAHGVVGGHLDVAEEVSHSDIRLLTCDLIEIFKVYVACLTLYNFFVQSSNGNLVSVVNVVRSRRFEIFGLYDLLLFRSVYFFLGLGDENFIVESGLVLLFVIRAPEIVEFIVAQEIAEVTVANRVANGV